MDAAFYRSSRAGRPPLRVGLLLDTISLPRWSAEVVDHILQSDFASIELLVFNGSAHASVPENRPARSLIRRGFDALLDPQLRRSFAFSLYQYWDRRNVDPATDPFPKVDCTDRLTHVESIRVEPLVKRFVQRFPPEAIEKIRSKQIDVLIRFGFGILRGDVLSVASYGVWSYHHGDNDYYRGGPAYFWEIYEGNPVSGAILQVLTEQLDAGKVLYKGLFATHEGFSQARNRVQPYWGASSFVIQKLRELHAHGWEHVEANVVKPAPYQGRKKIYVKPTNLEMLRWLVPLLIGKALRRLVRRPMIRHWRIAIRVGARPLPSSTSTPDMSGFRWIESPKGRFYADPFVIEADGKCWVYFEDFDYSTQLGRISCAEVREGKLCEPVSALERPHHLSYPCVFQDRGTWYMVPESIFSGSVDLYRCTRFPDLWQFDRELMRGSAVDTTIWIEEGVYWFFVTLLDMRGFASQLWLYSAAALDAPWVPHPANPISTDIRYARGGGAVFRHEGKLFRPSQDGRSEYGRCTILNEILVLDKQDYREVPRLVVEPASMKGLVGTHTYGRAGPVEIIDGKTRLPASHVL